MKSLIQNISMTALICIAVGCHKKIETAQARKSDIQWGFTTQNFLTAMPVSRENSLQFIDFAKEQGYSWIELRDPDASLTTEECREIAAHAQQSGIEIVYSVQRSLLAIDFKRVVQRGFENAILFKGPRLLRVLAQRDQHPIGWSESEFKDAVEMANLASGLAARAKFHLMIENADVILDGQPHGCFGLTQLFDTIDPTIELQLDTANIFTGPVEVKPQEAEAFIRKYASRISYVHIKSAKEMTAQPVLNGNPLKFKKTLDILTEDGASLNVAIELACLSNDSDVLFNNMRISLDWLKEQGLFQRN